MKQQDAIIYLTECFTNTCALLYEMISDHMSVVNIIIYILQENLDFPAISEPGYLIRNVSELNRMLSLDHKKSVAMYLSGFK